MSRYTRTVHCRPCWNLRIIVCVIQLAKFNWLTKNHNYSHSSLRFAPTAAITTSRPTLWSVGLCLSLMSVLQRRLCVCVSLCLSVTVCVCLWVCLFLCLCLCRPVCLWTYLIIVQLQSHCHNEKIVFQLQTKTQIIWEKSSHQRKKQFRVQCAIYYFPVNNHSTLKLWSFSSFLARKWEIVRAK